MKKALLAGFLLSVATASMVNASVIKMTDLDDCERVSNNIYGFWKLNMHLLDDLQTGQKKIPIENVKKDDFIWSEYQSDKKGFLETLTVSLKFLEENNSEIQKQLDKTQYGNLSSGLKYLELLYHRLKKVSR